MQGYVLTECHLYIYIYHIIYRFSLAPGPVTACRKSPAQDSPSLLHTTRSTLMRTVEHSSLSGSASVAVLMASKPQVFPEVWRKHGVGASRIPLKRRFSTLPIAHPWAPIVRWRFIQRRTCASAWARSYRSGGIGRRSCCSSPSKSRKTNLKNPIDYPIGTPLGSYRVT